MNINPNMKIYTEQQKFDNYMYLTRALIELRAGRETNNEDIAYFKMVRSYCSNFQLANVEVTDPKFRRKANETEQMCRYLQLFLNEHKSLEQSVYIQVLERIEFMFKHMLSPEDLLNILSRLTFN